jgi:hypothetical protein
MKQNYLMDTPPKKQFGINFNNPFVKIPRKIEKLKNIEKLDSIEIIQSNEKLDSIEINTNVKKVNTVKKPKHLSSKIYPEISSVTPHSWF